MARFTVHFSFNDLAPSYSNFFQTCSQRGSFFLSLPWFQNLSKTGFNRQLKLRIYGLESDDAQATVLAALPMCFKPPEIPLIQFNILRAATNYYSALFGPLISINDQQGRQNLETLIKGIVKESPRWDIIDLHPIEKESDDYTLLMQTLSNAGMAVESYFCSGNWYLKVANRTYQQYHESLPSRLKHTLQRKLQQLQKEGQLSLDIISSVEQAQNNIAAFLEIYGNSWKQPEPFPEFMPGWILESAKQGWLRMGIARINNKPVAVQIWLVHRDKASIYKLAYDKHYAKYSVGSILTGCLLQHVIDVDRVGEVDFLNGDESYKQDWMSHRREYWGIIAYNRQTLKGQLSYYLQRMTRHIKHLTASFLFNLR